MKTMSFARIEADFFTGKNPLKKILSISLDLLSAKQSGLLYGSDKTYMRFIPSSRWDRGVIDRFDGRGMTGILLKLFGTWIITMKGLSPVFFYTHTQDGTRRNTHGIIAYVLRNSADYYRKGINVIICPGTERFIQEGQDIRGYHHIPFYVYDGRKISKPLDSIKVDTRIVRHFKSTNSIYIILPDYGILVINTADPELLAQEGDTFIREAELRRRLDMLISLVERSSLAYLGQLKGKKGAELLWRKEVHLRRAYTHLSESEKRFRDLYENAPSSYLSLTPEGMIFECNRKAEELTGLSRDDLMGKSAAVLFLDHDAARQQFNIIWERLIHGRTVKDLEVEIVHRDGTPIWVSLSMEAIFGPDGKIIEMRGMLLDISERKKLEKQLFQAQKMEAIGTLSRGIAHDFNNILSPVSGYAQMLLMEEGRPEADRGRLQTILDCTRHARELVTQIMNFSRQREHQLVLVDVRDTVDESMTLVRSFLLAGIRLSTRFNTRQCLVMADPVQLHQVVVNLITNSIQAMEAGNGRIEVDLEKVHFAEPWDGIEPGGYVCLTVTDDGVGIKKADMDRIFESGFSTRNDRKSSGIGLSVVQGIVRGHGGHIRVRSEEGQGASFMVYLPICRNGERPDALPGKPQEDALLKGDESILLVDDDTTVAYMHASLLESLGYQVTCCTHSQDALDLFSKAPDDFDLVISDLTMPEMGGLALAKEICAIRPGQKVMICTGMTGEEETEDECWAWVAGVIGKPVEIRPLSRKIRQVLDRGCV